MGVFDRFFAPPTQARFAAILISALKRAGDDRQLVYDPSANCIRGFKDGESAGLINPSNLYKSYCELTGASRKDWLRKTCIGMLNHKELSGDFEDVRPDLRPALRNRASLDFMRLQVEGEGGTWTNTPSIDVSDQLAACVVYDLPHSMRFVSQDDLETWDVPLYLAMESAIQNLEEQTPELYIKIGESLYIFRSGDGYDATRMLTLNLMARLEIDGNPVALPVHRDCLMVTGSDDDAGLTMMATLAEDELEAARPVSSVPHILRGDEWQVWIPPAGHAAAELFRVLAIKSIGSEYAEQKELLEPWLARKGDDAFVASYSGLEIGEDKRLCSWCAWTKGVFTWLPKAELIAFFDPESKTETMVEWDDAMEAFGPMMDPMECWPPRWAVREFPANTQLKSLAVALS